MSESHSINDLFKVQTREQFIQKYGELKNSGEDFGLSIFDSDMQNSIGYLFDYVDTDKNGSLEEGELNVLMNLSKDDNDTTVSENDLQILYKKIVADVLSKYNAADSPEKMYDNALRSANGDMRYSSYIEGLEEDIGVVSDYIALLNINSNNKITDLQNKINELIQKNKDVGDEFKQKFKEETSRLNKLRKEAAENSAQTVKKETEINSKKEYANYLKREISKLDTEKDADEIKQKKAELFELNTEISGLSAELSKLSKSASKLKKDIEGSQRKLKDLQLDSLKKDDNIKSRIGQLQAKIQQEQDKKSENIIKYTAQKESLEKSREYAFNQISAQRQEGQYAYTNNDNAMTFAELEAQGLKYSASKGQLLAQDVGSHAAGFIGKCSNRVANGLQRTGLGNERMPSACMMDDAFRRDIASGKNNNFREIKISSQSELRNLPAGCIIVYEAGARWGNGAREHYNYQHGHIEVTLGNGTAASDGITRNIKYAPGQMSVFVPVESA